MQNSERRRDNGSRANNVGGLGRVVHYVSDPSLSRFSTPRRLWRRSLSRFVRLPEYLEHVTLTKDEI